MRKWKINREIMFIRTFFLWIRDGFQLIGQCFWLTFSNGGQKCDE